MTRPISIQNGIDDVVATFAGMLPVDAAKGNRNSRRIWIFMEPIVSTCFDVLCDGIAQALSTCGYTILPAALPAGLAQGLMEAGRDESERRFVTAATGREQNRQLNLDVRSDKIDWVAGESEAERGYLAWMEALRLQLNRRLFLGLFDYECLFACYEPGAFYKTHFDAFEGRRNRILSTVYYLNPDWAQGDGGELRLYQRDAHTLIEEVKPTHNTLVLFLSERFPHEVLPAVKHRYSLTGWFRINTSSADNVDPPA
jgi:SM-20-related protein